MNEQHLSASPAIGRGTGFRESMELRRATLDSLRQVSRPITSAPLMESQSPIDYLAFEDEARVYCCRDLVRIAESTNDALILSQVSYWFRRPPDHVSDGRQLPRARVVIDGTAWLSKTQQELANETGLSPSKVKRSLNALRAGNFVTTRTHFHNGRRTSLHRLSDGFLENRQLSKAGVTVYATTVRMTGRAESALILSQLCYWSSANKGGRCRLRVSRNGEYWIAKTVDALADEVGMRPRQVRGALEGLLSLRVIVKDHFIFAGRRMLHLRIDANVFCDLWTQQKQEEYSERE